MHGIFHQVAAVLTWMRPAQNAEHQSLEVLRKIGRETLELDNRVGTGHKSDRLQKAESIFQESHLEEFEDMLKDHGLPESSIAASGELWRVAIFNCYERPSPLERASQGL
jgi:hypothetical protein